MQHNLLLTCDCINWVISENTKLRVSYDNLKNGPFGPFFKYLSDLLHTTEPRQLMWHVIHENIAPALCKCGSPRKWVKNNNDYRYTCGPKCAGAEKSKKKPRKPKVLKGLYYNDPDRLAAALKKRRENSLEKYGADCPTSRIEVYEKRKKTNLERYGVEHPFQNLEVQTKAATTFKENHKKGSENHTNLIDKRTKTSIERYGTEHPMQSDLIKDKQHATMIDLYGNSHALLVPELNNKRKRTNLEKFGCEEAIASSAVRQSISTSNQAKYGVDNWTQTLYSDYTKEILFDPSKFEITLSGKTLDESRDLLQVSLRTILNFASKYSLRHIFSRVKTTLIESKIDNLLFEHLGNTGYIRNTKSIIPPKELDFYIDRYKLAIEVNGIYWHSELGGASRDRNYHINKWKICNEKNITLLQFNSIDIENNWHIVESKIKRHIGVPIQVIGARKLSIQVLSDTKIEREFLNQWHLQGATTNRNFIIGAYYENNLIGISTWKYIDNKAELVRFATNINFSFPGLLSRMIKRFIQETGFFGKLLSYSSNNHGDGKVYRACGFTCDGNTAPGYLYTCDYLHLESRVKYQKHKLQKMFNLTDEQIKMKSEWEIMQEQGYDRIWDSGNTRWVKIVGCGDAQ